MSIIHTIAYYSFTLILCPLANFRLNTPRAQMSYMSIFLSLSITNAIHAIPLKDKCPSC